MEKTRKAARTILRRCLQLPEGAELVIFVDETTQEVAALLAEEAVLLGIHPLSLFFSHSLQRLLGARSPLPSTLSLLNQAMAALICLDNHAAGLAFRDQARLAALDAGCRVAHMPGIDGATLELADVDYDLLTSRCELLAQALAKGHLLEIVTRTRSGAEQRLSVPLHPWERLPIISDGLIDPGAWGNVPSGETYIAPPEGQTSGAIVVNGSLPGYILEGDQELLLTFEEGRLQAISSSDNRAVDHLETTQIEYARELGDENWNVLAEIGLGVNPLVDALTGRPLFDEKKYGTLHIALGDNTDMGGVTQSAIHCDLVCLEPEVYVDGRAILAGGEIVADRADWYEDFRTLTPPAEWNEATRIVCTAAVQHIDEMGRLHRTWDTSSGKLCSVPVGNDESARRAASLCNRLRDRGQPFSLRAIAEQAGSGDDVAALYSLVALLVRYGLVREET